MEIDDKSYGESSKNSQYKYNYIIEESLPNEYCIQLFRNRD